MDPSSPWWQDNVGKLEQICVGNLDKNLAATKGTKPDLPVLFIVQSSNLDNF